MHNPESIAAWLGRVEGYAMVIAVVRLYEPFSIKASRLGIGAAAIASVRMPSKLTINTRSIFGAGVAVKVGMRVTVGGSGVLVGRGVAVGVDVGEISTAAATMGCVAGAVFHGAEAVRNRHNNKTMYF